MYGLPKVKTLKVKKKAKAAKKTEETAEAAAGDTEKGKGFLMIADRMRGFEASGNKESIRSGTKDKKSG